MLSVRYQNISHMQSVRTFFFANPRNALKSLIVLPLDVSDLQEPATHGRVCYTALQPVLPLDVSVIQKSVLPLHVSPTHIGFINVKSPK
jgi:hypothetical protein